MSNSNKPPNPTPLIYPTSSSPNTRHVYIVFYSRFADPTAKFNCFRPISSMLDMGVDFLTGPFTHCHLAYAWRASPDRDETVEVLCTKITAYLGRVRHILFKDNRIGDCYLRLTLTDTEYNMLVKTAETMEKNPTCMFSYKEFFGLTTPDRPSETRQSWTCASLTGYLLQRIGVLSRDLNVNKLNVTDIYFLLRQATRICTQVDIYPFQVYVPPVKKNAPSVTPQKLLTPDEVFLQYRGLSSTVDIPLVIIGRKGSLASIDDP